MHCSLHCVTLRVVKHSDNTSIVTVWSRERGRLSIAVPAGKGREAQRRRALMMPFSLFAGEADIRGDKDLIRIHDVRPWGTGNAAATYPMKNLIAMFLADFLCTVLRENQPDPYLTDYISRAAEYLSIAEDTALANFHLWFLMGIGRFIGIAPDLSTYSRGRCFDMREGIFTVTASTHTNYLYSQAARMVWILSRSDFHHLGMIHLSRRDRNEILDRILQYYTMHHTPLMSLPSLSIIRDIMRD